LKAIARRVAKWGGGLKNSKCGLTQWVNDPLSTNPVRHTQKESMKGLHKRICR